MQAAGKDTTKEPSAKDAAVCEALRHPIRVRILEVLCETDISPVQFYRRGCLPPGFDFDGDEKNAVSSISYHFKILREAGCAVVIREVRRRGATEHVYRSMALALHTDEEFQAMSFDERVAISRSTLQTLFARAEGAIQQGTFDARVDRHLSWVAMELDEEGWEQLRDLQAETLERAQGIKAAAIARKQERREAGTTAPTSPATFGALAFESPPIPELH